MSSKSAYSFSSPLYSRLVISGKTQCEEREVENKPRRGENALHSVATAQQRLCPDKEGNSGLGVGCRPGTKISQKFDLLSLLPPIIADPSRSGLRKNSGSAQTIFAVYAVTELKIAQYLPPEGWKRGREGIERSVLISSGTVTTLVDGNAVVVVVGGRGQSLQSPDLEPGKMGLLLCCRCFRDQFSSGRHVYV